MRGQWWLSGEHGAKGRTGAQRGHKIGEKRRAGDYGEGLVTAHILCLGALH